MNARRRRMRICPRLSMRRAWSFCMPFRTARPVKATACRWRIWRIFQAICRGRAWKRIQRLKNCARWIRKICARAMRSTHSLNCMRWRWRIGTAESPLIYVQTRRKGTPYCIDEYPSAASRYRCAIYERLFALCAICGGRVRILFTHMNPLVVNCPCCGQKVAWVSESRYRPFCSERCRQMDLGAWAAEKYTIEGNPEDVPSHQDSNNHSDTEQ